MTPRVLIVEDDPDIALIARELISVSGLDVTSAYTVDEALGLVAEQRFDAAVVDLQLPGRSGWDFVAHARTVVDMPVVIYSVHADEPELAAQAGTFGAHVVSKSEDPSRLVDALTSMLASRAAP